MLDWNCIRHWYEPRRLFEVAPRNLLVRCAWDDHRTVYNVRKLTAAYLLEGLPFAMLDARPDYVKRNHVLLLR